MRTAWCRVWSVAVLCWIGASALACWLYPVTLADSCSRYAPMADAFARGDFYHAFHPRFGVLFSALAGVFSAATGLSGIQTIQVTACLLLVLAAVVMYAFVKSAGGSDEVAWWTFALVLLTPDFFCYALDGLRDSGKCLVFALICYSVASSRSRAFALALLLYITLFTYGFVAASVCVILWCVWFACRKEWSKLPLPVFGWTLGTAAVTLLTHAYTGYWLPVPQFADKLGRWL